MKITFKCYKRLEKSIINENFSAEGSYQISLVNLRLGSLGLKISVRDEPMIAPEIPMLNMKSYKVILNKVL